MTYKNFLTEEAVQQFRKEGANFVSITLMREDHAIRTLHVNLVNPRTVLSISGRTPEAQQALAEHFVGSHIKGRLWYPFITLPDEERIEHAVEARLKSVADIINVPVAHLEYSFILDEDLEAGK